METVALRNKIIQLIKTSDERFLRMIDQLYTSYQKSENSSDFYEALPSEIQELLTESRQQASEGMTRSHENVIAEFREKYNSTQ